MLNLKPTAKFSSNIAKAIIKYREEKEIETTLELVEIIKNSVPEKYRRLHHPARKIFQAIRIEVNDELNVFDKALDEALDLIKVGGRVCVITFHSLEDRMVKLKFKEFCTGCTCPADFPVCVCGKTPRGKLYTNKPIEPTEKELNENARSRSAKLRVIIKL